MITEHTKVYVVIPTMNRPGVLARTIQTLASQTVLPAGLIVVDESSARVEIEDPGFPVNHICDPGVGGRSQARNLALELIKDGIVLFLDDDVEMEPDFIAQILSAYTEHPEADGISGIITNYFPTPLWRRAFDRIFRFGLFFDERMPIYWNADKLRDHGLLRVYRFTGCLMSFPRSRIGEIRFDDRPPGLPYPEDCEFCYRLGENVMLYIAPKARLRHVRTTTTREDVHWVKDEMLASQAYASLHGEGSLSIWLMFAWFKIGMLLLTAGSSIRRRSLQPFREFRDGAKIGRELGSRDDSCR